MGFVEDDLAGGRRRANGGASKIVKSLTGVKMNNSDPIIEL
jgi:hypothetical protein